MNPLDNIHLLGEPVGDGGDGDLAKPLHLGHNGLAVVEALSVLQPDLSTSDTKDSDNLIMTALLDLGVDAEIEDGPAQGRGSCVKTGTKEVKTDHYELFLCKVRIARPLLYKKYIHKVSRIVLLEVSLVFSDLIAKEVSHGVDCPESSVVSS